MSTTETNFVKTIFGSFFRWWWAVITGIASIFSYLFTPDQIVLSRIWVSIFILLSGILLFFAISTIYQGWLIFRNREKEISVLSFIKSDNYENDFVFTIKGFDLSAQGKIVEFRRVVNGVEVPFALVEIKEINSSNCSQADPIFISSGHLRDLRTNRFSASDIIVSSKVSSGALELYKRTILET